MMIKDKLLAAFENLEKNKTELLSKIKNIEYEKLNKPPTKDKWSIAQICQHLIISEKLSVMYINKKLHYKTGIQNTNIASAFRLQLLQFAFNSPFAFKAPENVAKLPVKSTITEIIDEWEKVRVDLKKIIEELPAEFLIGNIFKHPLVGKMNLYHTLKFFNFHISHHRRQIERLHESAK